MMLNCPSMAAWGVGVDESTPAGDHFTAFHQTFSHGFTLFFWGGILCFRIQGPGKGDSDPDPLPGFRVEKKTVFGIQEDSDLLIYFHSVIFGTPYNDPFVSQDDCDQSRFSCEFK